MDRLWVRLTASHAALVLLAILATTLITAQALELALRREAARQVAVESGLLQRMQELANLEHQSMMAGFRRGQAMMPRIILADRQGNVRYDWRGETGRSLTPLERRLAVAIVVDGQVVAYVLPMAVSALSEEYALVLRIMRRTMLVAGLVAGLGALVVSLLVSESVTQPLRRLVAAARAIAGGDLKKRIEARGPRETRSLAEAFNQMAASLEEAEQRRRDLTADIAHELRTPLAVLQGNLSAILDGVYTPSKEEVAALYDQVLRLNGLVADLGELAQFDSGHLLLQLGPADLVPLLERTVALFQPAAEAKGVSVATQWPAELPLVTADAARVGQVLNNLLSNALRYTPPGGEVVLGADAEGTTVEIWVADTGEGIPEADLPHVFQRFWRAEHSRSREHGGAGLGLAIVKQLVEAMSGTIGVQSDAGKGARFWFRLPQIDTSAASQTPLPGRVATETGS